jgi:hypothetical protein
MALSPLRFRQTFSAGAVTSVPLHPDTASQVPKIRSFYCHRADSYLLAAVKEISLAESP